MGTDFFSSMFQGIGETFKAGAAADAARQESFRTLENNELAKDALFAGENMQRVTFLQADAQGEQKIQIGVMIIGAVLLAVILYLKNKS